MVFKVPLVPLLGVIITYIAPDVCALRGFDRCPAPCSAQGFNPVNWTTYSHLSRLSECNKAVMVDFSIYSPVDKDQRVRSCAIWGSDFENIAAGPTNSTVESYTTSVQQVNLELAWWDGGDEGESRSDTVDAISAMKEVKSYLTHADNGGNNRTILITTSGNVVVGFYVGIAVVNTDVPNTVMQPLIDHLQTSGLSKGALAQVCGTGRTNQDTVGIIAMTNNNGFALVQSALRTWASSRCVENADTSIQVPNILISTAHTISNSTIHSNRTYKPAELYRRGDCRTITVVADDTCYKLASKCSISLDQFQKYNPGDDFCAGLQPTQRVCCTSGTIPSPKANSDGSCASYRTVKGDTCSALAKSNGITVDSLEKFNKDTWGEESQCP